MITIYGLHVQFADSDPPPRFPQGIGVFAQKKSNPPTLGSEGKIIYVPEFLKHK